MVLQQKTVAFIFLSSFILSMFFYNYYNYIVFRVDVNMREMIREPINDTASEDFLINTTGCIIPNYGKSIKFIQSKDKKQTCGQRAIFVEKIANDSLVLYIDKDKMRQYIKERQKYQCCYTFASRSKTSGKEDIVLTYTSCKSFKNGSKIGHLEEVITVTCTSPTKTNKSTTIYQDAYMLLRRRSNETEDTRKKWNVLLLGMDTMSRARILSIMPKTANYLQSNGWLDYKGYQKVGYNTFPNVMSFLTGMKLSSIYKACRPNMFECNELMMWSIFRRAGYVTAFGEDNIQLPDTFFRYNGFKSMPTHHYMRPLFLTGEHLRGNVICTKHLSSGRHILDYAYDFAGTYEKDGFFGMFWINSFSHNQENLPSLFENDILHFFKKADAAPFMKNTFIVLFSDHGIRFGPSRLAMEFYYEERLPMFFLWVPTEFRKLHEKEYYNLQLNQNRLVTPYNLYKTLVKISNMSVSSANIKSEACPSCNILFDETSPNTTCSEAGVSEKWCSCHDLISVDRFMDKDATASVQAAVLYVQAKADKVKTINCMKCYSLQLNNVVRTHSFREGDKTYYVVVFQMNPGYIVYEATVVKYKNEFSVLNGVDTLSGYNARGSCVKNALDKMFCVCKRTKCSK